MSQVVIWRGRSTRTPALFAAVALVVVAILGDTSRARADLSGDVYDDVKAVFAQVITDEVTNAVLENVVVEAPAVAAYFHDSLDLVARRQYGSLPSTLKTESIALVKDFVVWEATEGTKTDLATDIRSFLALRGFLARRSWYEARYLGYCGDDAPCKTSAKANIDYAMSLFPNPTTGAAAKPEVLARLRCTPSDEDGTYEAPKQVPCFAPQIATDWEHFAKPPTVFSAKCPDASTDAACLLGTLVETAMLGQGDRAKQVLVQLAIRAGMSILPANLDAVTLARKVEALIDELVAGDGRSELGRAFDVLMEFAGTSVAGAGTPSTEAGPSVSASTSASALGSAKPPAPTMKLTAAAALSSARAIALAWSAKTLGKLTVGKDAIDVNVERLYEAVRATLAASKLDDPSVTARDLLSRLLAYDAAVASNACKTPKTAVTLELDVGAGLNLDVTGTLTCKDGAPQFDVDWPSAMQLVRQITSLRGAFDRIEAAIDASTTLLGRHISPADLMATVTALQQLEPLIDEIARGKLGLAEGAIDAVEGTLRTLVTSACNRDAGLSVCTLEFLFEGNGKSVFSLVSMALRGDFRQAALGLAKSALAPSSGDTDVCSVADESRRFVLSFAAFVLDESTAPGGREAVREGFRSAGLRLISCFSSDGYQLITKTGWHQLGRKTWMPVIGLRWSASASYSYVFGDKDSTARFMPTVEWPNFVWRLSPHSSPGYMLGGQLTLIDALGPLQELALRRRDFSYDATTLLLADWLRPRLSFLFGLPTVTTRVWLVAGIGLRFIAPDRAKYDADAKARAAAGQSGAPSMSYRPLFGKCDGDYCGQHSTLDFLEFSVGAQYVF